MVKEFLKYRWNAKDEHSLHSPFVFDFYKTVIKNRQDIDQEEAIKAVFKVLKNDDRIIEINDLGAGSKFSNKTQRKVKRVAATAVKCFKWSKIIAGIIQKFDYKTSFELGTSLGLTTALMSKASPYGKVYTFEGCSNTLSIAKENFKKLECKNITPILGDLDQTLQHTLEQVPKLDLVFFDANHQYGPTIKYFEACLAKVHEEGCFVFDDINWSDGMRKAWDEIIAHPEVTISIDLFQMGIVFFRKKQPKQHFLLKA
ncbi:O-methyltransferase [Jiulongibacter sp. NS-SX5]|uniref:O-methyltransferase n=1 Tax=Jiulongibacter sp. NS-SX5 TaxID=3463854 RepID=UPI0040582B7D